MVQKSQLPAEYFSKACEYRHILCKSLKNSGKEKFLLLRKNFPTFATRMRNKIQTYLPYYKRLASLAFPLVLTQSGQMLVQLVDNAMVGHVGTIELAASSFANSIFLLVLVLGTGICVGITPILGHAFGEERPVVAASIIKNSIALSLLVTLMISLTSWSLSFTMPFMGQEKAVFEEAIPYYRLLSYSLIPLLLFTALKQIGEGMGNTLYAMIATLTSNIVNVILNYILIFGHAGFPALGLEGAGYATLIARIVMFLMLIPLLLKSSKYRHIFKLTGKVRISWKRISNIFKTGLPIALQMLTEVSLFAAGSVMMGWIGDVELAAHQVANGLIGFTFMIANALSMASTIRISIQYGNKNFREMRMAANASKHMVLMFMGLCAILYISLDGWLPKIFSTDPKVWAQASSLLIIAGIFQLVDGLQVVSLGILRGVADVKKPMIIALFTYLAVGLPVSYLFAFTFGFGAEGIWFGYVASLSLAALLFSLRIKTVRKELTKKD